MQHILSKYSTTNMGCFYIFKFIVTVCVCACACTHKCIQSGGVIQGHSMHVEVKGQLCGVSQRSTLWGAFSPSTCMWVPGTQVTNLVVQVPSTHQAIPQSPFCLCYLRVSCSPGQHGFDYVAKASLELLLQLIPYLFKY